MRWALNSGVTAKQATDAIAVAAWLSAAVLAVAASWRIHRAIRQVAAGLTVAGSAGRSGASCRCMLLGTPGGSLHVATQGLQLPSSVECGREATTAHSQHVHMCKLRGAKPKLCFHAHFKVLPVPAHDPVHASKLWEARISRSAPPRAQVPPAAGLWQRSARHAPAPSTGGDGDGYNSSGGKKSSNNR